MSKISGLYRCPKQLEHKLSLRYPKPLQVSQAPSTELKLK